MSVDEAKFQITIWSILAAPLIMSNDLRTIKNEYKVLLLNKEVIAVDQDILGKAGWRVTPQASYTEIWKREVSNGLAVVFANKWDCENYPSKNVTATLSELGLDENISYLARDLWKQKDIGHVRNEITMEVNCHGAELVLLKNIDNRIFV